jgi:SP family myo-inositol transporter-like MFS transporter 13
MLGLAGLPSLIMFIGFFFMPESPRWLVFRGKTEKAKRELSKVRQHHEVDEELAAIMKDREDHKRMQGSK